MSSAACLQRPRVRLQNPQALETGQKVVIDLDFADLMREPEQKSICGQLAYSWHANSAAQHPLHLVLTSVQVGAGFDRGTV